VRDRRLGIVLQRLRQLVEPRLGPGDPGAPREVAEQRLTGPGVRFLRQVADAQRGRVVTNAAGIRLLQPREDPEQRRLADAVRPDQPDPRARRNDERDAVEDELGAVVLRDVGCGERADRGTSWPRMRRRAREGAEAVSTRSDAHRSAPKRHTEPYRSCSALTSRTSGVSAINSTTLTAP
jgi:hypothetical protein